MLKPKNGKEKNLIQIVPISACVTAIRSVDHKELPYCLDLRLSLEISSTIWDQNGT